jgi:hypothetical protein
MQSPAPIFFSPVFLLFVLLSLVSVLEPVRAGSITFNSEDGVGRVIHFTGNGEIGELHVGPGESIAQDFPDGWTGNFYATCDGCDDAPGMLGEVAFDGFEGKTFYDVSAIVDPNDHAGVHRFAPGSGSGEEAGCDEFPCPESTYYQPDDVQTKVSDSKDFVVSLSGGGGSSGGSGSGSGYESGGEDSNDEAGDSDVEDGDEDGLERRGRSGISKGRFGFVKRRLSAPKPDTVIVMVPVSAAPEVKST